MTVNFKGFCMRVCVVCVTGTTMRVIRFDIFLLFIPDPAAGGMVTVVDALVVLISWIPGAPTADIRSSPKHPSLL